MPGIIGSSSQHNVNIRSSGVSPSSFGVNLENDFNINPEEAAEVAAAVADMDIPDSEFLNAGSISQEEFDSFSSFLGNPGRQLQATAASNIGTNQGNSLELGNPQDDLNAVIQQNDFPFNAQPPNPQNSEFNLFQHPPTDSSQDFPF